MGIKRIDRRDSSTILKGKMASLLSKFRRFPFGAIILILPGILWLLLPKLRRRYRFIPAISTLGAVALIALLISLPALGPKSGYDDIVPRVLITRTNGEKVAEGAMPFG